jgi:predicted nucleotidyltransferase component of viral defense system
MIPQAAIVAWRAVAPWADDALVEQDLVLSRALVDLFSEPALANGLAFRGGTALHKLVLAPPSRYSEDVDLVQVKAGPIGPILTSIRGRLDPWLGEPRRDQAEATVTLTYRFRSEIPPTRPLRLKVEINTREHFAVHGHSLQPFEVKSRWFSGAAKIPTFMVDELLATKLRALYQRRRGRDLFDLWAAWHGTRVDAARVVATFGTYMAAQNLKVTRTQFERNFAAKARDRAFLEEPRPLLAPGVTYDPEAAVGLVRERFVVHLAAGRHAPRRRR